MNIDVKLGCSLCRHFEIKSVSTPFNCANLSCPKCGESNSLSIISVIQNQKPKDSLLDNLYKIREL